MSFAPTPIDATLPASRSSDNALYAPSTSDLRFSSSAGDVAAARYSSGSCTEPRPELYFPSSSLPFSKQSKMPWYEMSWTASFLRFTHAPGSNVGSVPGGSGMRFHASLFDISTFSGGTPSSSRA